MTTLTITVSGTAGTGKTTIANYIADSLALLGIGLVLVDDDGSRPMMPGQAARRLVESEIDKKVEIVIQTVQAKRGSV